MAGGTNIHRGLLAVVVVLVAGTTACAPYSSTTSSPPAEPVEQIPPVETEAPDDLEAPSVDWSELETSEDEAGSKFWEDYGASTADEESWWPDGGLGWNEAGAHAGEVQRVCGPMRSIRNTGDAVFYNVGRDYPSADRFAFVLWGDWWVEPIATDATICSTGAIYLYDGVVAQIEIGAPEDIEIWE